MDKQTIDEEILQPMELFHARSLFYIKRWRLRKMTASSDAGSGQTRTAACASLRGDNVFPL